MADIFISYASEDRPAAQRLAGALEREGWSVWWDRVIPPGRTFAEAIEEQLTAAGCVVVLWSETAVASRWVQREARFADRRGRLIPALIAEVEPPFEFSDIHAAPLTGWEDREPHLGYRQLVEAVAGLAGPPPREQRDREETARREAEAEARRTAEEEEARREVEAEEESKRKAAEEEFNRAEERREGVAELARKKVEEEEARKKTEAEAKRKATDHEARKKAEEPAARKQADAEAGRGAGAPQRTVRARTRLAMAAVAAVMVAGIVGAVWWQSSTRTGEDRPVLKEQTAGVEEAKRRASPASGVPIGQTFKDCDVCPEMVVVPAGSFMMGSPPNEEGRYDDEGPRHRVTIAEPFAVGINEVTFAEWDACVDGGGCRGYRPEDQGWGRGQRPVIKVSWQDARSYVKWLSDKTGKDYRLLSEAEWEYAARAGTTTAFYFGRTVSPDQANYNGNYTYDGGPKGTDREKTVPVGSFPANAFGVHDMHGNVAEWVEDVWHEDYTGAPDDGSAWTEGGDQGRRVLRGGSWSYRPRDLRSANRGGSNPDYRGSIFGFRVARTF